MRNDEKLGTAPLGRLMLSLALPTVLAQLINVLYNVVDRIYIGHMQGDGNLALTGVGVTLPIITLIAAFSAFAGAGGAPLAAIELGKKDERKASLIMGNSAWLLVFFSIVLTIGFLIFKIPILYAFGASSKTIAYANDYITIYLLGTIFVQLALGLNAFISGQGAAKAAMLSVLIGAVINIVLDPIFIFALHLGVRGAALATVISQFVSAVWVVSFLKSKRSVLYLKLVRPDKSLILKIAALGIAPFVMQSTESLVTITFNTGLQRYGGDLYVGSMSILMSIMQLIVIPVNGITQGVQPIVSYNYGAGNRLRVKETVIRLVSVCLLGTLILAGVAIFCPGIYASMFTNDAELVALTCRIMPIFFLGIAIFGIQAACQSTFLALGQAKVSLFIATLRKIILLIPLALILPKFLGVKGIYIAEPVSDVISVIVTSVLCVITLKRIFSEMEDKS
ncbi:MATE family efflux transporter [Ligilactobacillus ruminis]|uniref:Multidrug export protein MepA n=1 Tax=Ligilactobacillus ruminis ATCC 25644 TaxID=525362 RepID=E7FN94_9LACO|nr:MATE family efflux transporter [Ligilactobacillus ruminis]EFZ35493.1 MATE efflux family protein [Ligilactobacillus ruminis ATCC 25644]EGX99181.1 MATE efflux family protein [Ligilactobacillus ruminis ATCC 25644]UWP40715.1 MATE family efflux transporter [Ligilactobacillus ruminis]